MQAAITGVPEDTKDKDEILENEFFDARQAFLSLCRVHHNQFDTLRRAKHSSMMMLYHLHHPASPAFGHGLGCEDRNPRSLQVMICIFLKYSFKFFIHSSDIVNGYSLSSAP